MNDLADLSGRVRELERELRAVKERLRAVPVRLGGAFHNLIPVKLHNLGIGSGGSAGTRDEPPTYTYDAYNPDGNYSNVGDRIAFDLEPVHARPRKLTNPATHGLLRVKPDGTLELWWTDEIPVQAICDEEPPASGSGSGSGSGAGSGSGSASGSGGSGASGSPSA